MNLKKTIDSQYDNNSQILALSSKQNQKINLLNKKSFQSKN